MTSKFLPKVSAFSFFYFVFGMVLAHSTSAEISGKIHTRCLDAKDYSGCVNTMKKSNQSDMKDQKLIEECHWKALDKGVDVSEVCPPCDGGRIPITYKMAEKYDRGECYYTWNQEKWKFKQLGCGLLGISVMDPKIIGDVFKRTEKTCFD